MGGGGIGGTGGMGVILTRGGDAAHQDCGASGPGVSAAGVVSLFVFSVGAAFSGAPPHEVMMPSTSVFMRSGSTFG